MCDALDLAGIDLYLSGFHGGYVVAILRAISRASVWTAAAARGVLPRTVFVEEILEGVTNTRSPCDCMTRLHVTGYLIPRPKEG